MSANLTRLVVSAFEEPGWDYGTIRGPYSKFHIANGAKYCVYNNRLMPVSQQIDRLDGYWTADAFLTWEPLDKRFELELAAYNIFDTDFSVASDTPGWGRTLTGTFKVRF